MAWTYSGDPSTSPKDLARFYCGDTDSNAPLLSDEEINYQVTTRGSAQAAAPIICVSIMAKLARQVDYTIGPERVQASQRFKAYKELVAQLRALWISSNAAPSWQEPISGTPTPIFDIGMMDNGNDFDDDDSCGSGDGLDG